MDFGDEDETGGRMAAVSVHDLVTYQAMLIACTQ